MSHIFLYGPSGTGKSTIGALLAQNLKLPFIDLDCVIETQAGMPIAQIMEQQGETVFRDLKTLLERLKAEAGKRPLLAGDLETKLSSILEKRHEHHASFPLQIDVDNKTVEQVGYQTQI